MTRLSAGAVVLIVAGIVCAFVGAWIVHPAVALALGGIGLVFLGVSLLPPRP